MGAAIMLGTLFGLIALIFGMAVHYDPEARSAQSQQLWEGTKHQYPLYDALAMGIQIMVFAYILGSTDANGRIVVDAWADRTSTGRIQSSARSIISIAVIGNLLYGAVFAPHLVTKLGGWVTAGPTAPLFPGVPNQPQ